MLRVHLSIEPAKRNRFDRRALATNNKAELAIFDAVSDIQDSA